MPKEYIEINSDTVTLRALAAQFGYHPVYISRILSNRVGKTFSELLLESRMRKAKTLLELTDLSIELVAAMIGYSSTSNFYKAFRQFYGTSPRKIHP